MMDIAVCGVARSGSTLCWQLLSSIVGPDLSQIHPAAEVDLLWKKYIVTIRHPFDIAASRYRVRLSRDIRGAGWVGLEAEIYVMLEHFEGAKKVLGSFDSFLLRYEDFYADYDCAFDCFEDFLNISISAEQREAAKVRFSLQRNKERQAAMKSFLDLDPTTRLHGDHIGAVHPGTWKDQLEDWGIDLVRKTCTDCAKEWNYEID